MPDIYQRPRAQGLTDIFESSKDKIRAGYESGVNPGRYMPIHERLKSNYSVIAYSEAEQRIGSRSLFNNLSIAYNGAYRRNQNPRPGMHAALGSLIQAEGFMVHAENTLTVLKHFYNVSNPPDNVPRLLRSDPNGSFAHSALADFYLARRAKKAGIWPVPKSQEDKRKQELMLLQLYHNIAWMDEGTQADLFTQAIKTNEYRHWFWKRQLESVESHPAVELLIEEAARDPESTIFAHLTEA